MPLVSSSTYQPSRLFRNAQVATTLPTLLRRVPALPLQRKRITTSDGDFIDLDCLWQDGPATVVLCHGLEGNAHRQYMTGMARAFGRRGWNVVGYNYRGCSGEPNHKPYCYHSGATDDLRLVLRCVDRADNPVRALVGFSLGGNLILKYLGEDTQAVLPSLRAAVTFSVPVNLAETTDMMARKENWIYSRRFLKKLSAKITAKAELFPRDIDLSLLSQVKSLENFDNLFTAPLSGFADAADYYRQCSALQFLSALKIPALLVSAMDDPFLGPTCYPRDIARASEFFHLEIPQHGGHVGFRQAGGEYWSERRAVEFVEQQLAISSP